MNVLGSVMAGKASAESMCPAAGPCASTDSCKNEFEELCTLHPTTPTVFCTLSAFSEMRFLASPRTKSAIFKTLGREYCCLGPSSMQVMARSVGSSSSAAARAGMARIGGLGLLGQALRLCPFLPQPQHGRSDSSTRPRVHSRVACAPPQLMHFVLPVLP